MKTAFVLAAAGIVAAQVDLTGVPECAVGCITPALAGVNCNDSTCACDPAIQAQIAGEVGVCITVACTGEEVSAALGAQQALCAALSSSTTAGEGDATTASESDATTTAGEGDATTTTDGEGDATTTASEGDATTTLTTAGESDATTASEAESSAESTASEGAESSSTESGAESTPTDADSGSIKTSVAGFLAIAAGLLATL